MKHYSAIKRNEIWSFVKMWIDLEYVIQSEASQKEKNKYHILTHIDMEPRKMVLHEPLAGQQWRQTAQTCGHSGARRERDNLRQ